MSETAENQGVNDDLDDAQKAHEERRAARVAEIRETIMNNPKLLERFLARMSEEHLGPVDIPNDPKIHRSLVTMAANWLTKLEMENRCKTPSTGLVDGLMMGLEQMEHNDSPAPRGRSH